MTALAACTRPSRWKVSPAQAPRSAHPPTAFRSAKRIGFFNSFAADPRAPLCCAANWYEERFQDSSGTNVGLRVSGRGHHEEPPPTQMRERDPSMSSTLGGGIDVLPCIARLPQESSERTMHLPECEMDYQTTMSNDMSWPTEADGHRGTNLAGVQQMKDLGASTMINDGTFYETGRARESSAPAKGFGATVPSHDAGYEAREWGTTTSEMMEGGVTQNHPSKVHDTLSRLDQKPTVTEVRGGFEKAGSNRLAVFPRMHKDCQPRPLISQDFRRKLGPKMGHDSLGPVFSKDRVARKTAFLTHSEAYLRSGKQIWSG